MLLLAWNYRQETPLIRAHTTHDDVDGSRTRLEMIPRVRWEQDARFVATFGVDARIKLQRMFGESTFCQDTQYVCMGSRQIPDLVDGGIYLRQTIGLMPFGEGNVTIRGAAIVKALTGATTRVEDVVDAFAWLGKMPQDLSNAQGQGVVHALRERSTRVHGCTTPQGSAPIATTRAFNNEVAIVMMRTLRLEFTIRLTGLRSAAHLNGREGVVRDLDSANWLDSERWNVRLEDGKNVSVKAAHIVHIRRGDYRREQRPNEYQ
jgi:hypothetical protein